MSETADTAPPTPIVLEPSAEVDALLWDKCTNCHIAEIAGRYLDLVEPGVPEASLLYLKLSGAHAFSGVGGSLMPPGSARDQLSNGDVELVRDWILAGASPSTGAFEPARAEVVLDTYCSGCHVAVGAPLVPLMGTTGRADASRYPRVEPHRPWRSSVYRFAVDHRAELDTMPADLPADEIPAYLELATQDPGVPEEDLRTLFEALGG